MFYIKALNVSEEVLGADNEETIPLYYNLGWFYYNRRNHILDKGYNYLKKYIEFSQKKSSLTLQSHLNISVSYFMLKEYIEALTHMNKIIELNPTCLDEFDKKIIISLIEILSSNIEYKVGESLISTIGEIINKLKI